MGEQAPEPAAPTRRAISKGALREFVETVVLALILFLAIRVFVMNYRVIGHSMEPNVHAGQYLFIDKLLYGWGEPRRGDIIVLRPPDAPGEIYLKRVIGLPAETVQVVAGVVLINGQALEEPWVLRPFPQSNWGPAKVGDNELFVLGDNRPGSRDSRYFGMLTDDRVVGRAFLCYWPPKEWTTYGRYAK
jgi:signal peptidase I